MGDKSAIEWTQATWNPITGCSKVSPGCKNCYAERLSKRLQKIGVGKYRNGFRLTIHPDAFDLPLRWKNRRRIFVNSMSDLFHQDLPFKTIRRICRVMEKANWHTYQILTKRPQIMERFFRGRTVPEHIWLGTSVELRQYLDRLQPLRRIDVRIRFISFEPLLGPIGSCDLTGIAWAIVGGESGPGYRLVRPEWIRELRDQCLSQGVRFFFKQWGGPKPKSQGRILDGRTWNEYPENGGNCDLMPENLELPIAL